MDCAIPAEAIATALAARGWWVGMNAFPPPLLDRLREALAIHDVAGRLEPAAIGRGSARRVDPSIRGDRTRWLDAAEPAERELLETLDELRVALNRYSYLGLDAIEAHYATYAPGTGYRRHLDTFHGTKSRAISFVLYLNEGWSTEDAGELVLFRGDSDEELARVTPSIGTLVMFVSAEIPHEVRPSSRARRSIAGWFRRRRDSR